MNKLLKLTGLTGISIGIITLIKFRHHIGRYLTKDHQLINRLIEQVKDARHDSQRFTKALNKTKSINFQPIVNQINNDVQPRIQKIQTGIKHLQRIKRS